MNLTDAGISRVAILVFANAPTPITSQLVGRVREVMGTFTKAPEPIAVVLAGRALVLLLVAATVTEVREVQSANALAPIVRFAAVLSNTTLVRLVHPSNALAPMVRIEGMIATSVTLRLFLNTEAPILVVSG